MKSSAKKVELASVDDLFSTEESRADAQRERVLEIPLSELHPFKNHPFKVKDDEAMLETADSIRQYGVLVPAIARPDPEGGYELVAGHRRHRASELAEKETMPVIVRELDDDAATIIMGDSNLQRESLLPSERCSFPVLQLPSVVLRSCERLSFKWFLLTLSANPKTKQFTSSMLKSVMRENLTTFVLPLPQTNSCVSTMPASRSV